MERIKSLLARIERRFTLRTRLMGGFTVLAMVAILLVVSLGMVSAGSMRIERQRRAASDSLQHFEALKSAVSATMLETADFVARQDDGSRNRWRAAVGRLDNLRSLSDVQSDVASLRFNDLEARQAAVFTATKPAQVRLALGEAASVGTEIGANLDQIIDRRSNESVALQGAAVRQSRRYQLVAWAGAATTVLVALALGLLAYSTIFIRLARIRAGVGKIASGKISARLEVAGTDELAALSAEFNRMAVNLETAETEQKQRYAQLSNLYKISKEISASLDIDGLLARVLGQALRLMGAETGSIMLLTKDGQELQISAARGLDQETIENTRVKLGQGVSGKVAATGEAVIIQGGVKDSQVSRKRASTDAMSVPLIAGEKIIGVINANKKGQGQFDRSDLRYFTTMAGQVAAAIANTALIDNIQDAYFNTIKVLAAAIDAKDPYTHGHSERVAKYAVTIARQMELSTADITRIEAAAYLHDIGKIGVPDGVLNKAGKLTDEEMALIKDHPAIAADILGHIDFPWGDVIPGVRGHHERFDGRGYPDGTAGYDIPKDARIIAVADTFDAMTSDRPYRKGLDQNKAITELVTGRRGQFDQEVVDAFVPALLTTLMSSVSGGIEESEGLEFSASGKTAG